VRFTGDEQNAEKEEVLEEEEEEGCSRMTFERKI
jgi:hypothetical protein